MKRLRISAAVAGMSFCIAFGAQSAFADMHEEDSSGSDSQSSAIQEEEQTQQTFGSRPQSREARTQSSQSQSMMIYEASEIEGLRVETSDGESLGSVDSVAVDLQGQHPSFIVVESNSILGIGGELRVVPVEAVEIVQSDDMIGSQQVVRVEVDKTTWEAIPTHERAEIADLCDPVQSRQIYQQFNVEQSTEFGARSSIEESTSTQSTEQSGTRTEVETPPKTPGEGPQFGVREETTEEEPGANPSSSNQFGSPPDREEEPADATDEDPVSDLQQDVEQGQAEVEQETEQVFGATGRQTTTTRTQTQSSAECKLVLTTDLDERMIQGSQQDELGTVDSVILDLGTGQVQYVLITPEGDGIMDTSSEVYALAPQALTTVTDEQIVVNVTRQDLDQAEVLTQNNLSTTRTATGPQVFVFQREAITFGSPDRNRQSTDATEEESGDMGTETDTDTSPEGSVPPPHDPDMRPGDRGIGPGARDPGTRDREFQGRDDDRLNRGRDDRDRQMPTRPGERDSRNLGTEDQDREFQGRDRDSDRTMPRPRSESDRSREGTRDREMEGDTSTGRPNQTPGSSPSRPL